jgi:hypothetical protein
VPRRNEGIVVSWRQAYPEKLRCSGFSVFSWDTFMPSADGRTTRLLDLVLSALQEAKATQSKLTITLLEMAYLNEVDQTGSTAPTQPKQRRPVLTLYKDPE